MTFSFFGTKAWLYVTKASNHGNVKVSVNSSEGANVSSTSYTREENALFYVTEDLEDRSHIISEQGIAIDIVSIQYLDNSPNGLIDFESKNIDINKGESAIAKLVRVGDAKGNLEVKVKYLKKDAIEGTNYQAIDQNVNFADCQKDNTITIKTLFYQQECYRILSFSIGMTNLANELIFVPNTALSIKIVDAPYVAEGTGWTTQNENNGKISNKVGDSIPLSFFGNKARIVGYKNRNYGKIEISFDSEEVTEVETTSIINFCMKRKISTTHVILLKS